MPIPLSALSKHIHLQLVHDIRNFTEFKRFNYFGRLFQKWQWGKCQNIITVSDFSKNELVKNCNIDSENIVVSPNGIDSSYLKILTDVAFQVLEPVMLLVGEIGQKKDLYLIA